MAKLIKFPLEMADGTKARSIEELREHADIASIAAYYEDGKLYRWLLANYLDDEANKIKSITDSDNAKCMDFKRAVLKDVVQALEIPSISETQISEYRSDDNSAEAKQTIASSCEIEDDAELKAKLKSLVNNDEIDLDDWKICLDESEKENSKAVCIQDKNSSLFLSFDLKNDENFNKAVISSLGNLKKLKSIIDSTSTGNYKNTQQQPTDLSAFEFSTGNGECVLIKLKDTSLKHVVIPDFITVIGQYAFRNCSNLESVEIPNSVKEIGENAFTHCSKLKSIEIPNSVTDIGAWAFSSCCELESIKIPDSVGRIRGKTFRLCSSLKTIDIPDSIRMIGDQAFFCCSKLESVEIPKSTKIEYSSFDSCTQVIRR